jgi:hypothetical protein
MRNLPVREYLQTPQFIDRIYPVGSIGKKIGKPVPPEEQVMDKRINLSTQRTGRYAKLTVFYSLPQINPVIPVQVSSI